jgi:glyoxylase-like metal-dependent hydrolase (beta-lactamase superfamily II)
MLPAYLRSLRRVAALAPAIAYPGHGAPIGNPVARVDEILSHHEARKTRLAEMLVGRSWTLRELAETWYPNLELFNLFLALSEVVGHLDLLEDDGRVVIERRDGVLHYTVAAS